MNGTTWLLLGLAVWWLLSQQQPSSGVGTGAAIGRNFGSRGEDPRAP